MLNKRRYVFKNHIWKIIPFFLLSICFFLIQLYASRTSADNATGECLISKPENHAYYSFVDSKYHKSLRVLHEASCERVKDGRWDLAKGNKVMDSFVSRYAICRDDHIYQGFEELLKVIGMPESVVLAHKQFCRDTFDPSNKLRMKAKVLVEKKEWLNKEFFCQLIHEVAYPSGFLDKLLEPDLPCIRKYQESTDSICEKLRNDDIKLNEAFYRWEQANLEFENSIGPETIKKIGKNLKKPIEVLIDMFKPK